MNHDTTNATPSKAVTLLDVARAAGVSKTTASHALSGRMPVAARTREEVQRWARELGFEADALAQRLSVGKCEKTVGFYSLDVDLSCRTRQMQIIQGELNDLGYSVPIYAYGYRGRDEAAHQHELMRSLLASRPRAVVCNTSGVRPEVLARLERFIGEGGIVVCYGYDDAAPKLAADYVCYDEGDSFYQAARYLTSLGHRDIGLFSVGQRTPAGATLEGFERALSEAGAQVRSEWLFSNDGTLRYEEQGARLASEFLALRERPTAMIVANDYAAVAFMAEVSRAGVRVPEQLSVIGHDDDAIAPYGVVPLSTVRVPIDEMASRVVEQLQRRIEGAFGAPQTFGVCGQLVQRDSTSRR